MRAAAFLYPWDVVGDPDAPRRLAALGIRQVTLASAYHSVRALTPRHPRHRIVTARHSAVYYPPATERWSGQDLRPRPQSWTPGPDPFGVAAAALADAGLEVHSWVILAHNSRLGEEQPRSTVRNAYGDRYPWALCIARPEVRRYTTALAAEAAVRPGTAGTELESCGWYGFEHLHAHDKTGGVPLSGAAGCLMSLCFCEVCRAGYAGRGADPGVLERAVRNALAPGFAGAPTGTARAGREGEWAEVERLLGSRQAAAVAGWRAEAARNLQREAVAAVRAAAREHGHEGFRVLLHADPAGHRAGANPGVDPADVLDHADGVVLPCSGDDASRTAALAPFVPHRRPHTVLAANLTVVSGLGGRPDALAADAAHAAAQGADELRLYHAGLASDRELAAVRTALTTLR
ncbi:hypothetical protein GCM10009716_29150 [Streptomyces sodiiphilus]|uniref:Alanine-rich protein n=1 Tax=Streptomyces sodiiphilus TaxID=226217 RepID=A0ABP5ANA7_9ACTN